MNNKFPSRETVARLRAQYPAGTRVELVSMDDPYSTLKPGDCGTVRGVDDIGTIFVNWDRGSGLGLAYGVDSFKRLDPEMTSTQSFTAWMAVTESSRYKWVEDEIYRLNGRGAMYYTGGEDGVYMRIGQDGKLEAGNYEGAIPHIGEAMFKPVVEQQFSNFSEAYKAAMEAGGKQFMVDMFSGSERQPLIKMTGRGEPEEKPSVLGKLRDAQKAPKPPHKDKTPGRDKGGAEL